MHRESKGKRIGGVLASISRVRGLKRDLRGKRVERRGVKIISGRKEKAKFLRMRACRSKGKDVGIEVTGALELEWPEGGGEGGRREEKGRK